MKKNFFIILTTFFITQILSPIKIIYINDNGKFKSEGLFKKNELLQYMHKKIYKCIKHKINKQKLEQILENQKLYLLIDKDLKYYFLVKNKIYFRYMSNKSFSNDEDSKEKRRIIHIFKNKKEFKKEFKKELMKTINEKYF